MSYTKNEKSLLFAAALAAAFFGLAPTANAMHIMEG